MLFYLLFALLLNQSFLLHAVQIPVNNKIYSLIDYSHQETCYEIMPFFMSMYDTDKARALISPVNKQTLWFDQQGRGDVNPLWLNLVSNNNLANYNSQVTLTPTIRQAGFLIQYFKKTEHIFFDLRTAFVQCTTQVIIDEIGGGNGAMPGIANAAQAFEQNAFHYGKMGSEQHKEGIDDLHLRLGTAIKIKNTQYSYFMNFLIIDLPTGNGTQAEYVFEPQVGSNHWAAGFGLEYMASKHDFKGLLGANWRYILPAWEQRTFNLKGNGLWSSYLLLQDTYGLPTAPATAGIPAINNLTQSAYIAGKSLFNFYMRCKKFVGHCSFEIDYNYTFQQAETINQITPIPIGYGVYTLTGPAGGTGGVSTSRYAKINQDITPVDSMNSSLALTTADLDLQSSGLGSYASSTITFAILREDEGPFKYGFGISAEIGQSASALSSWSVWTKFELLFL